MCQIDPGLPGRTSQQIRAEIEARFGFFPPFFEPALDTPAILENLWQQTLSAYVNNPLPAIFKEKLFAHLSRYCGVPYCIICHCCALRPLGMSAQQILDLISKPRMPISPVEMALPEPIKEFPLRYPADPTLEPLVLDCAIALFLNAQPAATQRQWLRRCLGAEYYAHLAAFLSYIQTCHQWIESYPTLSYKADQRAQLYLTELLQAEPALADFFAHYQDCVRQEKQRRETELMVEIERRNRAEALLRSSEEQRRLTLEFTHIGSWDWNIVTGEVIWNDNHARLLGLDPATTEASYQTWRDRVHPDDIQPVEAAVAQALQTQTDFEMEYRIFYPDGSLHWLIGRGRGIYSETGEAVRMIGVILDISDRKRSETALQQSETRYRNLVEQQTDLIGRFRSDDTTILFVNETYCSFFGIPREDLIGQPYEQLIAEDDRARVAQFIHSMTPANPVVCFEDRVVVRGNIYWLQWNCRGFFDDHGNQTEFHAVGRDITPLKQIEIALRESEDRYRSLVLATSQAVWLTDADGQSKSVTSSWLTITGQTEEEQEGDGWVNTVHPSDREWVQQAWRQTVIDQTLYETEYRILNAKGEEREIVARGVPVRDPNGQVREWIGTSTDITDRKRAEAALRQSEEQLRLLMENMPVMLDAFDESGNIVVWNHECERVTGYRADEIVGNPSAMSLLYPDPVYRQQMLVSWRDRGNNYRGWEWDVVCKDGNIKTLAWSNISADFPIRGWTSWGIGFDVTDRKQAEAEIRHINANLEKRVAQRTAALENLIRELDSFSYSVSHDLRAPLRHVSGFVHALTVRLEQSDYLTDPKIAHYLQIIQDSSTKMGQLIDGLLTLSRVGRRQITILPVDLNPLVQTVVTQFQEDLASSGALEKKGSVEFVIHPLPTVLGDATLLQQVFANLLENAIKFSRGQSPARIEIGTLSDQIIFVRDNGIGFQMEYADQLFGAFQRLHSTSVFEGNGIGLAIVQKIIHQHGGMIWAESQPDCGATFYFKFDI